MKVLIVFGTTEGQTRKIAHFMADAIEAAGHEARIHDCNEITSQPDIADYDAVILAASVHHKRYQTAFYDYVSEHRRVLESKPLAFVSVSLAVTLAGGEAEARSYVDDFVQETGLQPGRVHLAEGAVRHFAYSPSEALTVDLVVFKGQKKMPDKDGNPEYTNWDALQSFTVSFIEQT